MDSEVSSRLVTDLSGAIRGEVDGSRLRRAQYSSDASNYRVVPALVAYPTDSDDVVALVEVARRHGVPITGRGGGTSCAGNAVGSGIVVDFTRHLSHILDVDPRSETAVVQPGVVLDDLQGAAAPHGLRFGPDPSSGSRCTVGGMIGNNACGPHAMSYGRTADNVMAMTWVDGLARVLSVGSGDAALDAVPGMESLIADRLALLRTEFGRFGKQVSGYSLEHLLPERGRHLAAALVGTEGTCGLMTEATVRLVPRSPAPALAVLGYPDMATAADDVPRLLPFAPLALEGLDAALVDVVRRTAGADAVPALPPGGGWLMVEVGGDTSAESVARAHELAAAARCGDAVVLPAGERATRLWRIRADGAGLAVRTAAGAQAWPGWEDSAVPPERLGDYLRDLQALMDEQGLSGLAYGHFGDGCVHLRLDFPLHQDGSALRRFLTSAATLVAGYGGTLSGEHGDGRARSELLPAVYSPDAMALMADVKALLDPDGLMNPGVVVDPAPVDADLRRPAARAETADDGLAFTDDGRDITQAAHRCVGIAACRADLRPAGRAMCPSFHATGDETDSTRGRARVLQEMLNGGLIAGDWSAPEVHEALDLCLGCKACRRDCPAGVDMAALKVEMLHRTYRDRHRPIVHHTLGRLPTWLRLAAPVSRPLNAAARLAPLRRLLLRLAGADPRRSLPRLPSAPFRWTRAARIRHRPLGAGSTPATQVALWVDSFTDALAPQIAGDAITVLTSAGCDVVVVSPGACCGLPLIATGQLPEARARLTTTVRMLLPHLAQGRVIVGLEPSCTATLRSDLAELLPDDPDARRVADGVRTVAELLATLDWQPPAATAPLLVQPHCHQHAVMGHQQDLRLLGETGVDVQVSHGCCGMAGSFGMEPGHYELSRAIAEDGVLRLAAADPDRELVADGFSCRTQIADLAGRRSRHLVEVLAEGLRRDRSGAPGGGS